MVKPKVLLIQLNHQIHSRRKAFSLANAPALASLACSTNSKTTPSPRRTLFSARGLVYSVHQMATRMKKRWKTQTSWRWKVIQGRDYSWQPTHLGEGQFTLWTPFWHAHANGNDTHSLLKVSPPEDPDTRLILDKMASFVAEGGAELERKAKEDYRDNPVFS